MRKKMTDKHKLIAYVLSTDADLNRDKTITQSDIAKLFGVSQPTVAQGVKEARLRTKIGNLQKELTDAKKKIYELEGVEALELPESTDSPYRRKP